MIINSRNDISMPMNSEPMFDVSRIIRPKKPALRYYTLGTENVAWVEGYALREGDQSKQLDHLFLETFSQSATAERGYVTDLTVNLTSINTLYVDWELTGTAENFNRANLIASTDKMEDSATFDVRLLIELPFARDIYSLSVSGLSGNYYVRVHQLTTTDKEGQLKVYRVWGEG